jgi:SRSO17 transposase
MIEGIKDWDPDVVPTMELTEKDMKAMAKALTRFHQRFSRYYRRSEQRLLGLVYLRGLFTTLGRKTVEAMALLLLGEKRVRSLQDFISTYGWDDKGMLREYQQQLAREISTKEGMISVDSSEFVKKGTESVGVGRQYCGTLGKVDNCQSGVFVGYAGENGYGLVDCRLYLPESWFEKENAERWKRCHIPEGIEFQSKVEIARDLINKATEGGLFQAKWLGCDSTFGRSKAFLDEMGRSYWYFAHVPSDILVWTEKPELEARTYTYKGERLIKQEALSKPITVAKAAGAQPLKVVNLGEGAKGPILAEVAAIRVWEMREDLPGEQRWLFIRKDSDGVVKYALSNAPAGIALEQLIEASRLRWPIEQSFQEGKQQLGMNEYEHRSWAGWHRHMLFVFMAQLFLLELRHRLKKKPGSDASTGATPPCDDT